MPAAPRIALVLGAGGSVGHAYHLGVLSALADELEWDARTAEVIIGTSAGSVVGAGLRAGLSALDMRARALGRPLSAAGRELVRRGEVAVARLEAERDATKLADGDGEVSEPVPEGHLEGEGAEGDDLVSRLRRIRIASPERVLRALREPWRVTPGSLYSAMMPPGKLSTDHLGAAYDELLGDGWPQAKLWIVAVRLDIGNRVVFGRDDISGADIAGADVTVGQAVQASCAVPGYFAPVTIGDERYVDGAVHSTTNADLAAAESKPDDGGNGGDDVPGEAAGEGRCDPDRDPDLVVISAPMSSERLDVDLSPRGAMRQIATRWLDGEVSALRRRGVDVLTFQPTAEDLEAMAGNSMDPTKAPAIIKQVNDSIVQRLHEPEVADVATLLSDSR